MSVPDEPDGTAEAGFATDAERTLSYHGALADEPSTTRSQGQSTGPRLGPYELLHPLRDCRNGKVYLARHPRLERTVQVRVFEDAVHADAVGVQEFDRFVQSLSQLAHPNVAGAVLEACLDGPTRYVALENSPGRPLSDLGPRGWLARQTESLFPNRRLGLAMLDAARGLAAIHNAQLVHGNVRPDVLRVDADGRLLLSGLGDDEATVREAVPFRWQSSSDGTDPRQRDLYALGAAFYYLLTGVPPSSELTPIRQLNSGVAKELSDILARCLAADSSPRYESAEAMVADLEQALQTETVIVPWGKRVLVALEAFLAFFGGAIILGLIATLIFGYQEGDAPTYPELIALSSPALLYWAFTEFLLGGTLLRRWQGYDVADVSGAPAGKRRRFMRASIKIAPFATWCAGFGWYFTLAMNAEDVFAVMCVLFNGFFVLCTGVYGFSIFVLRYRGLLGEPLSGADAHEAVTLLPHDRLTDTRLVCRQRAESVPLPAPSVEREGELSSGAIRLDQYTLGPRLGAGGMGTVYRGWDRTLARPAAVKVLDDRLQDHPVARDRFEREARLAAQLNHPNVAKVYGVGEQDGRFYIAMELVDGETLQELVRRSGPLSVRKAWRIVQQVAEALRAASMLGIVHRDIKPSNLMVTPLEVIKVTDFGLSRQQEGELALTETGTVLGTPLYMSPEQATGKPVDCRSDMYSLGMTLYFLLCGRTAFTAKNPMDLLAQQLAGRAPSLTGSVAGLTDEQAKIVDRLLEADPKGRFANYATLMEALCRESPEEAQPAPIVFRFSESILQIAGMYSLVSVLLVSVMYFVAGLDTAQWRNSVQTARSLVWVWQCLATFLSIFVVVRRPPMKPYSPAAKWSLQGLLAQLGNLAWELLAGLLLSWPVLHHVYGLRVIQQDGRALTVGRATLRLVIGLPILLPWAVLAFLPGVRFEMLVLVVGIANLGIRLVSSAVLLLRRDRRSLVDLATGTRVVQIPTPIVLNPQPTPTSTQRPNSPPRPRRAVRPVVAAAKASILLLLMFAGVLFANLGFDHVRYQRSRDRLEHLRQAEENSMRLNGISRIEARLLFIFWEFMFQKQNGSPFRYVDLVKRFSDECLKSPRGGKIIVIWNAGKDKKAKPDADLLLAYEELPDGQGRRYVVTTNSKIRPVGEPEFRKLLREAGH